MNITTLRQHIKELEEWTDEKYLKTQFHISTMTVLMNLETCIHLESLSFHFTHFWKIPCYYNNKIRRSRIKERMKNHRVFFNSVSFYLHIFDGKIHVKVFNTGTVHIAGCRTTCMIRTIPKLIFHLIHYTHEHFDTCIIKTPSTFSMSNVRVVMMKGDFSLTKMNIDRRNLFNFLFHHDKVNHNVVYEPDRYHGINLKLDQHTFLIFHTGKIVFVGTKLQEGYTYTKTFKKFFDLIDEYHQGLPKGAP